jgi:hypothetical protein
MFSPSSPPDEKASRKENLPNSSALINPLPTLRYSDLANGQPFPILASLFLESFS